MKSSVETSIIIRTFNEEKYLPGLLQALKTQNYKSFEVIVVDSGSIDNTRDIALEFGVRLVRISSGDFTFGYSLNAGIRVAKGKYIVLVSAHTLPFDKNWLGNLVDSLSGEKNAMAYGRQLGCTESKYSETRDFLRIFGRERLELSPPKFFANNANSAFRKEFWEKHPFNPNLLGLEDIEFAKYWMQQGFTVVYEPNATIHHIHNESWKQIRRRYHREAAAARKIKIKSKRDVLRSVVDELYFFISDIASLLIKFSLSYAKFKEVVLFRLNKGYGTAVGLLDHTAILGQKERDSVFFDRTCRAILINGQKSAEIVDLEIPEIKPGDVLIRTAHVAVCRTDLEIFDGTLGYFKTGLASYPIVPGHEFSGTVVAAGSKVTSFQEGDSVIAECIQSCGHCTECLRENFIGCEERRELGVLKCNGAYSEYLVVSSQFLHKLPTGFDLRIAALCEPVAVAIKAFRKSSLRMSGGGKVAVIGAGALGHICAKLLVFYGYEVTVFDKNDNRLDLFKKTQIRTSHDLDELSNYTNIWEVTGNVIALNHALDVSKSGSRIVLLGFPYGVKEFNFEQIVGYDKEIIGSVGSRKEDFREAIRIIDKLELSVLIKNEYHFSEYLKAWEDCEKQKVVKNLLYFHH